MLIKILCFLLALALPRVSCYTMVLNPTTPLQNFAIPLRLDEVTNFADDLLPMIITFMNSISPSNTKQASVEIFLGLIVPFLIRYDQDMELPRADFRIDFPLVGGYGAPDAYLYAQSLARSLVIELKKLNEPNLPAQSNLDQLCGYLFGAFRQDKVMPWGMLSNVVDTYFYRCTLDDINSRCNCNATARPISLLVQPTWQNLDYTNLETSLLPAIKGAFLNP